MEKGKKKSGVISDNFVFLVLVFIFSFLIFNLGYVFASEITGVLSTGIGNQGFVGVIIIAPTATPAPGTYTVPQEINVILPEGAIDARYTLDSSNPSCPSTGTSYITPIIAGSSVTVKAVSCYPNNASSTVASLVYTINAGSAPEPVPGGGGGGVFLPTPRPPTINPPLDATTTKIDANQDNKINILDFNVLIVNWGASGSSNPADFNKDNTVDILDFNMLMIGWTGTE